MSPAISPVAPSPTLPLSSRRPSVSFGGFGLRVGVAVGGGLGVGVGLHSGAFGLYMQYNKGLRVGVAVGGGLGVGVDGKQIGQLMGSTGGEHMSRCDSSDSFDSSDSSDSAMTVATRANETTKAARIDSHLMITPLVKSWLKTL